MKKSCKISVLDYCEGLPDESESFDVDSHAARAGNRYRAAADGQPHLLVCRYFQAALVQTASG